MSRWNYSAPTLNTTAFFSHKPTTSPAELNTLQAKKAPRQFSDPRPPTVLACKSCPSRELHHVYLSRAFFNPLTSEQVELELRTTVFFSHKRILNYVSSSHLHPSGKTGPKGNPQIPFYSPRMQIMSFPQVSPSTFSCLLQLTQGHLFSTYNLLYVHSSPLLRARYRKRVVQCV